MPRPRACRDMFRKNFKDNGFAGFGIQAVM